MAGLNYYIKLPDYDTKDRVGIDVKPIQEAARNISKDIDADRLDEYRQRTADISQQQADTHAQQVAQQGQQQQQQTDERLEAKKLQQTGGLMQFIKGLPEGDPRKGQLWNQFLNHDDEVAQGLKQAGIDPTDHKTGADFVLSKVTGYQDETKKRLQEAQANWYDNKGEAVLQNAATRKFKAVVDQIGPNPDPAMYARESQPGGLIHAAFNGVVPPREQWGNYYQHAQLRSRGTPTENDMLDLGLDPRMIKDLQTQNAITKMMGKSPATGHIWAIEDGQIRQKKVIQGGKALSENEKSLALNAWDNFQKAYDVLVGPVDPKTGKRTQNGQNALQLKIGEATGGWINSTGAIALSDAEAAAMDLSYFLSGKQIGNAEQLRLIKQYVPKPGDPVEVRQNKMERGMRFFKRMKDIHDKGGDVMDFIQTDGGDQNEGGGRSSGRTPAAPSKGGPSKSGWGIEKIE